ncbi:pachytene checkpoint protein 2 homolog [Chelonus insularis]|uniref:pachytene checkpoint protein 2 homolog n=1 Tax=Chelonus insularis TaxID=460826 RepID=UPI00158CE265|nr:pachytene checkpoint protein 2 homolog [Chelonus insularis]
MKALFDIEVCQTADSMLSAAEIEKMVVEEFNHDMDKQTCFIINDYTIPPEAWSSEELRTHVKSITCYYNLAVAESEEYERPQFEFFIYRLNSEEVAIETMKNDTEELPVSSHWILPCQEFHGLWESLHYESKLKENLFKYIETAMEFSEKNVDPNIISWNKVVLLHGPPGTGKTSLCKALAQKAAIRLSKQFVRTELVEINSHSLFSKWFSESGKLVMKLFSEIKLLLEDQQALIVILIDEVESLAHARKASMNGAEPSDSIRVVNSLLTQLDQIKRYKNVLILTTSNITGAIDLAFVDRADIKQYVGYPGECAVQCIYDSCVRELQRTGVAKSDETYDWCGKSASQLLSLSLGLSGRTLRKLPFLAHALYLDHGEKFTESNFFSTMIEAVKNHYSEEHDLNIAKKSTEPKRVHFDC